MEVVELRKQLEDLDPVAHKHLREALLDKYSRRPATKGEMKPPSETASDPFADMFTKAVDELNSRYIEGTMNHIRQNHPDLYQQTRAAEDRLNAVWKSCLEGKGGVEEFRGILGQWYSLQLKGIEMYSNEQEVKRHQK